jgi:hypothetical protein
MATSDARRLAIQPTDPSSEYLITVKHEPQARRQAKGEAVQSTLHYCSLAVLNERSKQI